jgi:hypothetical protein
MSAGKVIMAIFGALLGLVALGLLAAGGSLFWAYGVQRGADGYFTTPTAGLSTDTYALTSVDIDLGAAPGDWYPSDWLATIRFEVESDDPVFVGIGPRDEVDPYRSGVGRAEVTRIGLGGDDVTYRTIEGGAPGSAPGDEDFWVASAEGSGEQTLTWEPEAGHWTGVIMNADGSAGVSVDVAAGARAEIILPVAIGLLVAGFISAAVAAVLLVLAIRPSPGAAAPVAASGEGYGHYPVRVEGVIDPGLSRWQWLVKWLLAIPHFIVLAFLWTGFVLLTIVAWFAILFTGRYPRSIFDFNVGVLRWSWRVGYYSYGVLATDRYPPFTLAPADYPAELDVQYPERLSRELVLIKWWLLAIPHYLIVGLFVNGLVWWTTDVGDNGDAVLKTGGGLISILVFIAALILLFTGRYNQGLFDLIMGLQRWVFRVVAYAALMRDEYPPFRLDVGGPEPAGDDVGPTPLPEPEHP